MTEKREDFTDILMLKFEYMERQKNYLINIIRYLEVFTSVPFIVLTCVGNGFILLISVIIYFVEQNHGIKTFGDALWWSFATVTTVGYGDVVPTTIPGRFFGILAMIGGTGIFACYTAIFAGAFIDKVDTKIKKK